jgi:hypothetical protein
MGKPGRKGTWNRISTKAIDYSLLMKLAYSLTHPRGKILDTVLPSIFAFVRPSRRKTTLHKMDNCYLALATAYNGLRTKEVAEGNLDKVKRSL